ncbi:MAG: hypothetical protein WD049_00445 [Candidatus Paceibacterota bacterium]
MPASNGDCACCKARFVKFRLTEEITRDDHRQEAQVEAFWDGDDPTPSEGSFYVYNVCCEEAYGECVEWGYQGPSESVGYAVLDDQNESSGAEPEECFYRIIELIPCCEHTGDTGTVRFEITSADVASGSATATVSARPCCVESVPGESEGSITVVDALGCLFDDETDASLVGRKGFAKYMTGPPSGYGGSVECQWEIFSLCCN